LFSTTNATKVENRAKAPNVKQNYYLKLKTYIFENIENYNLKAPNGHPCHPVLQQRDRTHLMRGQRQIHISLAANDGRLEDHCVNPASFRGQEIWF